MRNFKGRLKDFLRGAGDSIPEEIEVREKCLACDAFLIEDEIYQRYNVCSGCRFHYYLTARERINQLVDPDSFSEINRAVVSLDPLSFSGRVSYRQRILKDQQRTGLTEAAVTGTCTIEGLPVLLVVLDFSFLGGSMGSVVGEKVALAFEYATKKRLPLVAAVTSGGVRMQEGVLSLMQMAKTTIAATGHAQKKLPFVAVLANPTTGHVFASFANLADVIIGEPGALIGLSPLGSFRQGTQKPLSVDAHTAESQLKNGMVDMVVDRVSLRDLLAVLLDVLQPRFVLTARQKTERQGYRPPSGRAWQNVQLARHTQRPTANDYFDRLLTSFVDLHGDRVQGDDLGVVMGLGYLGGQGVVVVGQERIQRDSPTGAHPRGFRKAQRAMKLASKFGLPLITLIDTPGAAHDQESDAHGIANALATTTALMLQVQTPTVAVIIGEGGSEAALALSVADRILMMERAIFSPISPEGAANLMYRDENKVEEAAEALKLTAADCYDVGIIDGVVPEPERGAHSNRDEAARQLRRILLQELVDLQNQPLKRLLKDRARKFRSMGEYSSHFRLAMNKEVDLLQGLVVQGVRQGVLGVRNMGKIRRRRKQKTSDLDQQSGEILTPPN